MSQTEEEHISAETGVLVVIDTAKGTTVDRVTSAREAHGLVVENLDYYLSNRTMDEVMHVITHGGILNIEAPGGEITVAKATPSEETK